MGRQQPKTPRFFIDMASYLHATGHGEYYVRDDDEHADTPTDHKIHYGDKSDLLYCNTASLVKFKGRDVGGSNTSQKIINYRATSGNGFPTMKIDCLVALNHNFEDMSISFSGTKYSGAGCMSYVSAHSLVNWGGPIYQNGFSIRKKNTPDIIDQDVEKIHLKYGSSSWVTGERYIGALFFGKTYTPPENCNTIVSMSRIFDGIRQNTTRGGYIHNNVQYTGSQLWSEHNPWELWDYSTSPKYTQLVENYIGEAGTQPMFVKDNKRKTGNLGRKEWTINIKSIREDDIFPAYESTSMYPFEEDSAYPFSDLYDTQGGFTFEESGFKENPSLLEDNFISRVWHPTLGGSIPFLFQPDKDNNSLDQFSICIIDRNSISLRPVAPSIYDLNFTVKEVW